MSFSSFGSGGGAGASPTDTDRAANQLQSVIEEETQKAQIQAAIAKLTEMCWDKCVGKPGTRLSGSEEDCLANCAARYLDTTVFIVNKMSKKS